MSTPLSVLLVEDSESDAGLITRALNAGGFRADVLRVEQPGAMRAALASRSWDVIISDFRLPAMDGHAAFAILRETGEDIPFLIVSGAIGEENAAELMRSGINDYVMKGNLARLAPVVLRERNQALIRRDRAAAEAALQVSNERYRILANAAPVGIFHTDQHGATTYVNPEWCRIADRTPDEALDHRWLEAVHPDDRPRLSAGWRMATNMEGVSSADYRFVRRDGSIAWVQGRAVPQRGGDGSITGYVGTITDITGRKSAEESLRTSEERYRLLTDHSGVGVGFYDANGTVLFFNSRASAALGASAGELVGRSILDLFHGPAGEVYLGRIRLAAARNAPDEYEDSVSMPGGAKWYISTYSRVLRHDGSVIGVQIISQDITARKQAELAARKLEREIAVLYESMRDGFVVTDLDGHILRCNDAYCDLLGYSREELLGRTYREFTPPASLEIDDAVVSNSVLIQGYSGVYEKEYITRSGPLVPVELRVLLIRDSAGNPSGMSAIVRDVTERRRAELEIRRGQQTTEAILNALTSHIAMLDAHGRIIAVNDAWLRFAIEAGLRDTTTVSAGANYLEICRTAVHRNHDEIAAEALEGILGVIEGRISRFYLEYPCHSPATNRWFSMHVSPLLQADMAGVVVAHENITDRKLSEMRVQELADEMRRLSSHLAAAREEERAHLAREIHDELGQSLTALKMDITDIRTHGNDFPPRTRDRLSAMGTLIDQTARTVQRLAGELRPPMLDELGLLAAVAWYIQDFEERFGIACTRVRFDDPPVTDRKRATALYRILQESLTNIARHAGATEVEIQLIYADAAVALTISDDGKGITEEEMKKLTSHGIIGMRERIMEHGGTLAITGKPGTGTTVHARIPWPEE